VVVGGSSELGEAYWEGGKCEVNGADGSACWGE